MQQQYPKFQGKSGYRSRFRGHTRYQGGTFKRDKYLKTMVILEVLHHRRVEEC